MRIKAKVPAVLGRPGDRLVRGLRARTPATASASPSCRRSAPGVWIEFEGGDVSYPIWTGCYWRDGELPSDASAGGQGDRHQGRAEDPARRRRGHDHRSSDQNNNTVTLDVERHHAERGGGQRSRSATSGVNVNDGALEVT